MGFVGSNHRPLGLAKAKKSQKKCRHHPGSSLLRRLTGVLRPPGEQKISRLNTLLIENRSNQIRTKPSWIPSIPRAIPRSFSSELSNYDQPRGAGDAQTWLGGAVELVIQTHTLPALPFTNAAVGPQDPQEFHHKLWGNYTS